MQTKIITLKNEPGTYFISNDILIQTEQDALDLMGNAETQTIILHDYNFEKNFFDLSTRKLGDILQKFSNYRTSLAIIGNFSKYYSKVLPNFIAESNRNKKNIFVSSLEEVIKVWG